MTCVITVILILLWRGLNVTFLKSVVKTIRGEGGGGGRRGRTTINPSHLSKSFVLERIMLFEREENDSFFTRQKE